MRSSGSAQPSSAWVPAAVIRFLREGELPVREDVLPEISRTIEEIGHSQSAQAPTADETRVAQTR